MGFPGGASGVLYTPANSGDIRDAGSIPGSRRSPEGGHGNPLQYFCLEKPMGRGAWQATVYRVAKSQAQMKRLSMHTQLQSLLPTNLEMLTRMETLYFSLLFIVFNRWAFLDQQSGPRFYFKLWLEGGEDCPLFCG